MFTGIIEATSEVVSYDGTVLQVALPHVERWEPIKIGESIAVNGACLTVVSSPPLTFELSEETVGRTAFRNLKAGSMVNLERAARLGDRLGGHLVQGHVDTVGTLVSIEPTGQAHIYRWKVAASYDRYLIDKGSITLNGISLTVVSPAEGEFDTWIIPHTLGETNLGVLRPGDLVNVEFDVIARYVEKMTING